MSSFAETLESALNALAAPAEPYEGNWDDVLARADKAPSPSRRRRIVVGAALIAIAALLLLPPASIAERVIGLFRGEPVPAVALGGQDWRVLSAIGRGVPLGDAPVVGRGSLSGLGITSVIRLGSRGGLSFYVIQRTSGSPCYAVGVEGAPELFGAAECGVTGFPSQRTPVLDLSVFFQGTPPQSTRVTKLSGFAADGVAAVELVTLDGARVARTPVEKNFYSRTEGLPDQSVAKIVALDTHGHEVFAECLLGSGCPSG